MNYNDFPILNNKEYQMLNEQYLNRPKQDRKQLIFNICKELGEMLYSCFQLENKFNSKILSSILYSKECSRRLLDNLVELFNVQLESSKIIKNFNLFTFVKKLSHTASLFAQWSSTEEKDYFKSVAQKSLIEILNCLENLMTSFEFSNVKFFKHM